MGGHREQQATGALGAIECPKASPGVLPLRDGNPRCSFQSRRASFVLKSSLPIRRSGGFKPTRPARGPAGRPRWRGHDGDGACTRLVRNGSTGYPISAPASERPALRAGAAAAHDAAARAARKAVTAATGGVHGVCDFVGLIFARLCD